MIYNDISSYYKDIYTFLSRLNFFPESNEITQFFSFSNPNCNNIYSLIEIILKNQTYSIDFIEDINYVKKYVMGQYKLIIISKIILDLINNFRSRDDYDKKEHEEKLIKIETENKDMIIKNKNIFQDIKIYFDEKKRIDIIYTEIIEALIKNRKFEDYEYTLNIMDQLKLEEIYPTEYMINELFKILNSNEHYINDYVITNMKDVCGEKKINFYYFVCKYLLKRQRYIYIFQFLITTKKMLITKLKRDEINFKNINTNLKIRTKFFFILEFIADSEYYIKKYIQKNIHEREDNKYNELFEKHDYYQNYLFESKKEDIKEIESIINNNKEEFNNYLKDYDIDKKMNDKFLIINYIYNYKNNGKKRTEKEFQKEVKNWEFLEKCIKDKKIKNLRKSNKTMLIKFFNDKYNKDILIKIFTQDQIDYFIKNTIKFKDNPKKDFYRIIPFRKKKPTIIKHVSEITSEIDSEIILNLVKNKSYFILTENDKNEFEYSNICFGENNIEIKNPYKTKILGHIENSESFKVIKDKEKYEDEKEKEENNKLSVNYLELCSSALKFKSFIKQIKEKNKGKNKIKNMYKLLINNNKNHFYFEEYLNDDIDIEENDSNQNESTSLFIGNQNNYTISNKLIYKNTISKNIYSIKKGKKVENVSHKKNDIIIILFNKNNELLFFDETLKDISYKFMSIFHYTDNKMGKYYNLKEIQRMIPTNPNNNKFKVNCVCQLLLIKEDNIEKTNYFYLGGSEKNKGKIKLYQLDNGKYEYIQDIVIEKGNNNQLIPPINSIVQSHKNGQILILYSDGNVDAFDTPIISSY